MQRSAALLTVLAISSVVGTARAARADVVARLVPSRHAACDLAELAPGVRRLMGRDVFVDDAPLEIRVAVAVHHDRRAARVELVERGSTVGVRTIEAATCPELVATLSVFLSIALRDRELAPDVRPPATTERAEVPAHLEPPATNAIDAGVSGAAGAAGSGWDLALVPGVRVTRSARSLGIELELRAPDDVAAGDGRVRVSTIGITLAPCVRHRPLAACAVLSSGWTRAAGEGLFDERVVRIPLLAAGARAEWVPVTFGRFAVQVRADVRAHAHKAEFLVDQMPVWTSRRIEGWLALGLVARIP